MASEKRHLDSSNKEEKKPPTTLVKPILKEYTGPITPKMEEQPRRCNTIIEAYEASLMAPPMGMTKETRPSLVEETIPLIATKSKPIVARVRVPVAPVVHRVRTLILAMPVEAIAERSTRFVVPIGTRAEGTPGLLVGNQRGQSVVVTQQDHSSSRT